MHHVLQNLHLIVYRVVLSLIKDARNVSYVPLRIKPEVLLTDVNYKLFRSFLPFLLNSALLFLIIVKIIVECKRNQYTIENKKKQRLRSEDDNAGR